MRRRDDRLIGGAGRRQARLTLPNRGVNAAALVRHHGHEHSEVLNGAHRGKRAVYAAYDPGSALPGGLWPRGADGPMT